MSQTHIHLLIVHLPIFGSFIGALVLIHGIWAKNDPVKVASYNIFILSSIGAIIAYLTGEAAEKSVEDIQGVLESNIHLHEDFALYALVSLVVLGFASIGGLFLTLGKSAMGKMYSLGVLFIALISFGFVGRTGYLGGQIRHNEINSSLNKAPGFFPYDNSINDTDDREKEDE